MARASSRSCDGEQHGKDQANRAPGRGAGEGERLKHAERCEPELEREVGCKDEVDRFERGRKRQVLQTAPATRQSHRCRMRQSPRSLDACLAVRSSGTGGDGGAAFGSSMILNQMPAELLETVLSYLARGPADNAAVCCGEYVSGSDLPVFEAGSLALDLQNVDQGSQRSSGAGKGSCNDLAPVQILFKLCAQTCHRWNKAVRSPQVLKKLSMVRFPLPAAVVHPQASVEAGGSAAATSKGQASVMNAIALQAGDELLDMRVESILRVAGKAGNDGAQFLLGLYLSRQKTFALLCLACPAPPATSSTNDNTEEKGMSKERRRAQERLREAVLDTYDEGVELLRSAGDLLHPNALYQLGMLAFGGTDVKLRSRLFGHDSSGGCGDCVLGEEYADLYWRRAAELGHLESRLIVDAEFRLNHLHELEDRMSPCDAERRSWRLCAGNRLLSSAKRPQSSSTKARECSHDDCGMYTLLCEFKQCAGCATSHKKQRYCNRACQKRDWALHRSSCGWFNVQ